MDGWVTLLTKLDTKQLEKDLKKLEKELQKYEKEAERLTKRKLKLEFDNKKTLNDLTKVDNKLEIIDKKIKAMEEVNLPQNLSGNIDYQKLLNQREELNNKGEEYLAKLKRIKAEQTEINIKTIENSTNQELVTQKIAEIRRKLSGIDVDFSKIGKSINGVIKKVSKWVLAVFSVRGAYTAIRSAMSTLSQYNEQLANQINTIRLVFASALEPIVTRLVDLVYRLLTYVDYIAKAWFDVDLFASASEKAMKNGAKNAEKMRKSMAGFDEMNVISDNSSSGASTGSGFVAPEEAPIPSWIQWIADNKDLVIAGLLGIGTALLLLKLGKLITNLKGVETVLSAIWKILQPLFTFIGANAVVIGGIILIIGGVAIAIKGVIDYLNDPTWENFGVMLTGIGIIAAGVLLIFGGFPALITLIIGAIVALGVAIYKNWNNIVEFTKELVGKIKQGFGEAIDWVKRKFDAMISFFGGLISRIVELFRNIGTKVGDAIGNAFKLVVNGVLGALEKILNTPIKTINKLLDVINKIPGINLKKLPTFNLPKLAVGGIVNNPGKGVPIGGAITGEAGAEGVIPLTNSQAMETLGQAIGKYVTINANITNTMNGRVISRELQKVNSSSDFAFNR